MRAAIACGTRGEYVTVCNSARGGRAPLMDAHSVLSHIDHSLFELQAACSRFGPTAPSVLHWFRVRSCLSACSVKTLIKGTGGIRVSARAQSFCARSASSSSSVLSARRKEGWWSQFDDEL